MEVGGKLTRRDFLVLGAFSLLLYCYACYGGRVLTQHEARLPQASIEMANAGEWLIPTCGGRPWLERPPLPHWLTIGIASVCGVWDQVWVFRIPNALAGVLSVLLTGWLGARFFGREIGLLSGLMLATSYEFVHYAWLAEEDIYLAAAVLVGMVLFVKLEFDAPVAHGQPSVDQLSIDQQRLSLFGNRSRAVWIFFLVMGLSNLVKGLCFAAVMVGLSGGAWMLFSGNPRRLYRYVWFWGACLFVVTASWWIVAVSIQYPEMLQIWSGDLKNRTDGMYSRAPFWLYGQTLLWALLPWTLPAVMGMFETGKKAYREPASAERLLWCWAVIPILFLSIPSHKHHHYLVPCLAPWGIFAAIGARTLWLSVPQWPIWLRQPALSALVFGLPAAIALGVFRAKVPGPQFIPWVVALCIPVAVFAIGRALLDRNGRRCVAVLMTILVVGYCGAYSYHGLYIDRYRTEAEFLQAAAKEVPAGEPIFLNADGTILNTFRNLFYLGDRAKTLHNLTFLLDEKITSEEVYLIGRRDGEEELKNYGTAEEVLACRYIPRPSSTASQWVLYRVALDPGLPRYPNDVRISALQAMERVPGPFLGEGDGSGIRRIDYRQ